MKPLLIALVVLAVGIGVWQFALAPSTGPNDGAPDAPPGDGDPDRPEGPEVPLPPEERVRMLLTDEKAGDETAGPRLKELAKTVDGANKLILLVGTLTDPEDRAVVYLLLVQGGTTEGMEFAVAAAEKTDGRDRVPAILGLAAGDASAVEILARLLSGTEEEGLVRTLAFALALNGSDGALRALDRALSGADSAKRRMLLYEALSGTPAGLPAGNRFFALMGNRPARTTDGAGYRGLIDRLSRENEPTAVPAAAGILAGMPGADAREGAVRLWRDAEGPVREEVFNMLLGAWAEDREGGAQSLVRVAIESEGPEAAESRRRVLERILETRDPDLIPLLERWIGRETDPDLRERLKEQVRRLREEG
jgi:hypothetical protein